jgi:DNA-binding GntR family transcriptional regulator
MTRSDTIRDRIRADILAGEWQLGLRLTLGALSERYQSSHMPVREALRELHGEGLVVLEPNAGARVRGVTVGFIEALFEMRAAMEALTARRAAERIGPDHLAELQTAQDRLETHAARGEIDLVIEANRGFHAVIQGVANNPYAAELANQHSPLLGALWMRFGYSGDRLEGVISDHRQIIQLLGERDGQSVAQVAAAHVAKAKAALLRAMRRHGVDAP